jgi:hypothetical protein
MSNNNIQIVDDTVYHQIIKSNIYPLFTAYFDNPICTKVKDVENFSMYACKIHAVLGIENRYLILFINRDNNSTGSQYNMNDLEWVCLQTRSMEDELKVNLHSYIPQRLKELNKKITLYHSDTKTYKYNVEEFPIEVMLLPRTKNIDYNRSGFLINALETYQTIINWKI